ncbi:mechanosensitive ion channel [Synechococcus sp. CS-1329]|nr:mechanosensitive ion channel [Synechococcus sp. CS-1329]
MHSILAITDAATASAATVDLTVLGSEAMPLILNLLWALAILLLGWLLAGVLSKICRSLLRRMSLDDWLSRTLSGGSESTKPLRLSRWISTGVFWVVIVLAVLAALDTLDLRSVSQPFSELVNQIFAYLPKLLSAVILATVAFVLATVARSIVSASTAKLALDEKLFDSKGDDAPAGMLISEAVANLVFWLIILFFVPLVLGALNLAAQITPVVGLFEDLIGALPRLVKALVIAAIGWLIANTLRGVVSNLVAASGLDKAGADFGLKPEKGGQRLSWIVGTLVYVLVLIPTATATLDALAIPALSGPATAMLAQVLLSLPQIFTALLIVVVGVVVGRFVSGLVERVLAGVGFNRLFQWIGLPQYGKAAMAEDGDGMRSPSELVGVVAFLAILLFSCIAASNVLALPALTDVLKVMLLVFSQILAGLVVFAIGLYLANLASQVVAASAGPLAPLLSTVTRLAIIAFAGAMALQQIGVAPMIVSIAFGLLFGSIAVAVAVAFGLGGKEVASEQLREWVSSIKSLK